MEIGVHLFAAGHGTYPVSASVDALVMGAIREIKRVFFNLHQREWSSSWNVEDPDIPGVIVRGFSYPQYDNLYAQIPADKIEEAARDAEECAKASLEHAGIGIWWYKYPGRSMTANIEQSAEKWFEWYESLLVAINEADVELLWVVACPTCGGESIPTTNERKVRCHKCGVVGATGPLVTLEGRKGA